MPADVNLRRPKLGSHGRPVGTVVILSISMDFYVETKFYADKQKNQQRVKNYILLYMQNFIFMNSPKWQKLNIFLFFRFVS